MPKWIDLNEVDDDDILLKRNRMNRSLVSDEIPSVKADAYEDDFLDAMEDIAELEEFDEEDEEEDEDSRLALQISKLLSEEGEAMLEEELEDL